MKTVIETLRDKWYGDCLTFDIPVSPSDVEDVVRELVSMKKVESEPKKKTLIEMLIEAWYPKEDIYPHESDLYIFVTPLTTKVLEDWCKENGWNIGLVKGESLIFSKFIDVITGKQMYDVAFQYTGIPNK